MRLETKMKKIFSAFCRMMETSGVLYFGCTWLKHLKNRLFFAIAYSSRGWYITQLESELRMTIIAVMATKILAVLPSAGI